MQIQVNNFNSLFLKILIFLVLLSAMAGCQALVPVEQIGNVVHNSDISQSEQIGVPDKVVASYITADSITELTLRATLIVIGQVEQDVHTINMARDVNDISKPDSSLLGLGQVYRVHVERVIEGTSQDSTIFIVQPEGFLAKPQASTEPSLEDVKLARQNYDYIPFVPSRRYLLFLHPLRGFEERQYFTGGIHPWRFDATDENQIIPESPAEWLNIRPASLNTIIEQIKVAPTPEPTIISPLPTPLPVETIVPVAPSAP